MASNIATGKRPQGPPPGDRAQSNLSSLAAALGVDPNTLLDSDLQELLGRIGQTGYGSTVKDSVSGGLAFDRYA